MARRNVANPIALGGIFAALAVIIMAMGGMIPATTFICPAVCMLLLKALGKYFPPRVGWAWYGAVAILSLLLSPDKEAAAVFAAIGHYPLLKPAMDKLPLKWLWKTLFFNAVILALYWVLMHVFGMAELLAEFEEMGMVMILVTLLMGNATFFLLDMLLGTDLKRRRWRR
ncbi:MAG: hypothetical protein E7439_03845 [Ruminococcaceae bacterium]|nr:hypothetical protein [Oscillospiraceae bacterium]